MGYLPKQPGYNKRLWAAAGVIMRVLRALASDTNLRRHAVDLRGWHGPAGQRSEKGDVA